MAERPLIFRFGMWLIVIPTRCRSGMLFHIAYQRLGASTQPSSLSATAVPFHPYTSRDSYRVVSVMVYVRPNLICKYAICDSFRFTSSVCAVCLCDLFSLSTASVPSRVTQIVQILIRANLKWEEKKTTTTARNPKAVLHVCVHLMSLNQPKSGAFKAMNTRRISA